MFNAIASAIIAPFSVLLRVLYSFTMSYGLSIVLFSLVVKLILLPFSVKMKRSTMGTSRLAPRVKELEKKYKNDQQKYADEVRKLYEAEKVNPLSGCLWGLIPLPIMLALYTVIRMPLSNFMNLTDDQIGTIMNTLTTLGVDMTGNNGAYKEIILAQKMFEHYDAVKAAVPEIFKLDFSFLGLNLAQVPSWNFITNGDFSWNSVGLFLIPILSGALAFFSSKLSMAANTGNSEMPSASKSMMYTMPLISVWIGFVLPASLGIYWISNSVFTIIQEFFLNRHFKKKFAEADALRAVEEEKIRALEAQRNALVSPEQRADKGSNKSKKNKQVKAGPRPEDRLSGKVDDRPYARGRAYSKDRYEERSSEEDTQDGIERVEAAPEPALPAYDPDAEYLEEAQEPSDDMEEGE